MDAAGTLAQADILIKVRRPSLAEVQALKRGAIVAAMLAPFDDRSGLETLAGAGAALLSWRLTDLLLSRGRGVMARRSRPLAGNLSATVAAKGPMWSSDGESGITPRAETRPYVGLSPTQPHRAAGSRLEPAVSVPIAA